MSKARVILGGLALLCVPAGIVLIAVAVLRDSEPPERPSPVFATTTTTAVPTGAWLLAPDPSASLTFTPDGAEPQEAAVIDGGIAISDDRVLGGTFAVEVSPETAEAMGATAGDTSGHLVVTDQHSLAGDDAGDEVITARIELGDAGWSVPGQGSFRVVDRDGERVVVVTFEGTAVSPNDAVAPGAPETTVILDATFGPPA